MLNEAEVKIIETPQFREFEPKNLNTLQEWFKNADKCVLQTGIRIDYTEQSKTIRIELI